MRTLLLALVALCVASVAMSQPVTRTDYPRGITYEQLYRWRSEAGIEDDGEAWYQDKTDIWSDLVDDANAAESDIGSILDDTGVAGASCSNPYASEGQAGEMFDAMMPVALVYVVTDSVPGQETLHANMLTKLRAQMDSFITQVKFANDCFGRDSLATWTGNTETNGGEAWVEDAIYFGPLFLWDVTHDLMVGGTAADQTRHSEFGRILFNQEEVVTIGYLGSGDPSRQPWYNIAMRRGGVMSVLLTMAGSSEVASYPEYDSGTFATRLSTFYPQWYSQGSARIQVGQGAYYSYADDGSGSSRALEDFIPVYIGSKAMPDSTDFRTTFAQHYLKYDDWTVNRVMSNVENVGLRGDDNHQRLLSHNITAAYMAASFEQDTLTIGLLDDIVDAIGMPSVWDRVLRFMFDDRQVTRASATEYPKGRLFGVDNIAWGTEKGGSGGGDDTGRGAYAYFRTKWGYDSQQDDPTPRSDVAVFAITAGPQTGSTHDIGNSGRGHYWLHRGDAWGTGRPGYYDDLSSLFPSFIWKGGVGWNMVRVIDPSHADYRAAAQFDATEWDGGSHYDVNDSWLTTTGSQRWFSVALRTNGWDPYRQYGAWAPYSYDRYKSGYFDKFSSDDDGFDVVVQNTWDFPNTDLSTLWDDDVSIDSAQRKIAGWQLNGDGELLLIRGEAYNPARAGITFVDQMWMPMPDVRTAGQTIGASDWTGGGTPLNSFSGTPGAKIGPGGYGYYYDVTDGAGETSRFVFEILGGDVEPDLWVIGGPNSQGEYLKSVSWWDDGASEGKRNQASYEESQPINGTYRNRETGGIYPPDPSFEFYYQGVHAGPSDNGTGVADHWQPTSTDSWGFHGQGCYYRLEARIAAADTLLHTWTVAHQVLDQGSTAIGSRDPLSGIDANHFGGAVAMTDTVYVALFNRTMTANDDWSFSTTTTGLPVNVKIEGMTPNAAVTINLPVSGTKLDTTDTRGFLHFTHSVGGTFSAGAVTVDDEAPTPEPLTNFAVDSTTLSSLALSWDAASDTSTPIEYIVEYRVLGDPTWISGGWGTATSRVLSGLAQGTEYDLRVQARDAAFNRQTLWASTTGITEDAGAPDPPTGLTATAGDDGEIDVTWDLPYDFDHQIEWQLDGGGYTSSGTRQSTETDYTITGLVEGDTYDVRMRGVSEAGATGSYASTTGAAGDGTPPTPTPSTWSVYPYAVSTSEVSMTASTATDPGGGIMYRFVETSGNPGGTSSGWQAGASYNDTGLSAGTQYVYYTQSKDASGNVTTASESRPVTTVADAPPPSVPSNPGAFVFQSGYMGEAPDSVALRVYLGTELRDYWPNDSLSAFGNIRYRSATLDTVGHWRGLFSWYYPGGDSVIALGGAFTQESYTPEEIDSTLIASHGPGDWTAAELDAVLANQLTIILGQYNLGSSISNATFAAQLTQALVEAMQLDIDAIAAAQYTESELYQYIQAFQPGTWSSVPDVSDIPTNSELTAALAARPAIGDTSFVKPPSAATIADSVDAAVADDFAAISTATIATGDYVGYVTFKDDITGNAIDGVVYEFRSGPTQAAPITQRKVVAVGGTDSFAYNLGESTYYWAWKQGYYLVETGNFRPLVTSGYTKDIELTRIAYDPPETPDVCNVIVDIVELTGTASDSVRVCADFEGSSATWSGGTVSDNKVCAVTGRSFGGEAVPGRAVLPLIYSSAITEPNSVTTYEITFTLNGREIYSDIEAFAVPDSTQCYLHLNLP